MSVQSVWIDGFMETYDSNNQLNMAPDQTGKMVPRLSIEQGSAVQASPGLFLTAGHVLAGPYGLENGDGTQRLIKALPQTNTYRVGATIKDTSSDTWYQRKIIGGSAISNINFLGYTQSKGMALGVNASDLTAFQSTPAGNSTPIIAFNHPNVQQVNDFFPSLSFTGYPMVPVTANGTTPKPQPNNNRTLQGVNSSGVFQLSGPADGGFSGAGLVGTSQHDGTTYGNTYIVGTVEGQLGSDSSPSTAANYINTSKLWSLFSKYKLPSGVPPSSLPRNELVGDPNGNDRIAGANAPENIIASGAGNKILAGSYGDVINPGSGLGNEVFIPSNDAGTTVLATPGSMTIVGGTSKDKLAVLSDRLWNSSTGAPSSSTTTNSSSTIQLLGGLYNAELDHGPIPSDSGFSSISSVAGQEGSADPLSWEIGNYDLQTDYRYDGKDLNIMVIASNPNDLGDPVIWRSNIDLVNYQPGEFGLTFKPFTGVPPDWSDPEGTALRGYTAHQNDELSMMAAPQAQTDLNDDANNVWNYTSMQPITPPSSNQLNSDLQALNNLYSNSSASSAATTMFGQSVHPTANMDTSKTENQASVISTSAQANQLVAAMSSFGAASGTGTTQGTVVSPTQLTLSADPTASVQHKLAA